MFHERDKLINVNTNDEYRVLSFFDGNVITCKINTKKLEVFYFMEDVLAKEIEDGLYKIESEKYEVIDPELYFISPREDVRNRQINRFNTYKTICSAVYDEYKYKLYELTIQHKTKGTIKSLCEKYGVSKQLFWKQFVRYLQSGLQDKAFTDQRVTAKKATSNRTISAGKKKKNGENAFLVTEKDKKKFQKHLQRYLHSEVKSKEDAYLDLIEEDYSVMVKSVDAYGNEINVKTPLPASQRPTRRQFFYYISTHSSEKDRKEAKKTKSAIRNNARVFTGTVMDGVRGPGHYVEMDAQEMDIALISDEYELIPVGRPIIYVMIDVMSEIILGVSLAMDNNSIVGCTNCFMNLIEDKTDILQKHGIDFSFNDGITIDDVWPTNIKPRIIKFDNGSDFISKPIAHILKELNIQAEFVSPATGSLKPLVENFFGTIKRGLDDLLENKGLIRQVYGSKHHEKACLTFEDAYRIVLNHVLYHNTHILTTYTKSADMKMKGIITSPMELWKYGNQTLMPATTFVSRDDALYHMLLPCQDAKLSRFGIERKGLPFFNPSDKDLQNRMFKQGTKTTKFECRYDPRDMGHLYYLKDGVLQIASLPSDDYRLRSYYGMSEKRFNELESLSRDQNALVEELNTQARINKRRADKAIINAAAREHPVQNQVKDMKKARKEEKEFISGQNSVSERFHLAHADEGIPSMLPDTPTHYPDKLIPDETLEQKRLRIMQEAAEMDEEDM